MEKEILRLFKGYLGERIEEINEQALKYGLLIPSSANEEVVKQAIEMYGKDGEKWNSTFHKDFEIVRNAPIEDLIAQQIIHYITTYGFESLGLYDSELVYLPKEKLEIPELNVDNLELITIRPLTEEELTNKLMVLLTSGIALSEQTVKDIMILADYIDKDRFDEIKNKEIKTTLYDKYNIMPKNADEFLRYLIFKTTGSTLKINNMDMVRMIKNCNKIQALSMITSYIEKNGYEKLSSIFLRNKNLFLAYKIQNDEKNKYDKVIIKQMNYTINKLRKYAVKYHKPMKKNILDCLTNENEVIDLTELSKQLDEITIFRELRILNGIKYRLEGSKNIVHRIRNGKSYVRTLDNKTSTYDGRIGLIYECVYSHLIERLKSKVKDKTIYIPSNVQYAVPTTEKMFSGNIPDGSYIEVPRTDNMVYGVYWKNIANGKSAPRFYGEESTSTNEETVDLDLKQMNKSEVFGWDASYRSETNNILFSGDMTDAKLPKGASELFYVGQDYGHGAFLITLNMYRMNSQDVPFEFVIAKATHKPENRTYYVLDPNNILAKFDMVIKNTERQMVVGFITIGDTIRFYFNDFSAGASIRTSSRNDITMGIFDYLQSYSKTQLRLRDVLRDAGAKLTDKEVIEKEVVRQVVDEDGNIIEERLEKVEEPVDINLSIENITKETIINLLS